MGKQPPGWIQIFWLIRCYTRLNTRCYNPDALQENRSGGRCRQCRERKVRTLQGSEPANGGASGILDFKFEI